MPSSSKPESDMTPTHRWTGGFSDLVGYVVRPRPDGVWAVTLELGAQHCNEFQIAHGGVLMTLLDIAGGCAIHALERPLARVATASFSVGFLATGQLGPVTALGWVDGGGATLTHTRMRVHQGDDTGPVLATAHAVYRLFPKRP